MSGKPVDERWAADLEEGGEELKVARIQERTDALGPGTRAVVWFHGCSFACQGCIAAEMNASSEFASVRPAAFARAIAAIQGIEGVTLSGGDPFDQDAQALAVFLEAIRDRTDLSVMCYTGRTLEQLRKGSNAQAYERVLANIDVLVDGLYVDSLNDGSAWRGSSNQEVHFLTMRYRHLESVIRASHDRRVEVSLDRSARMHITGIPPSGFMERLSEGLRARGLSLIASETEEQA